MADTHEAKHFLHEMRRLISKMCDDRITAEEMHRLDEALRTDAEVRRAYRDIMEVHNELRWRSPNREALAPQDEGRPARSAAAGNPPAPQIKSSWLRGWSLVPLTVALLLLIAVVDRWGPWTKPDGARDASGRIPPVAEKKDAPKAATPGSGRTAEDIHEFVGVIRFAEEPRWRSATGPRFSGEPVYPGLLHLESGKVEMELFGRAVVTLVGPCEVNLQSSTSLELIRGNLLASIVPEDARLLVKTPAGEIVHLGTVFGLGVAPDGTTDAVVYDGKIRLRGSGAATSSRAVRLVDKGTALRFQKDGNVHLMEADDAAGLIRQLGKAPEIVPFAPALPTISETGFTVRFTKFSKESELLSIADVDALLASEQSVTRSQAVPQVRSIDFQNHHLKDDTRESRFYRTYLNLFTADQPFPGQENPGDILERFVVQATGTLIVPDSWQYSFVVNVDDGSRLRIDGRDVIVDSGVHYPQASVATVALSRGTHQLELLAYNNQGFARAELGVAIGETDRLEDFVPLSGPNEDEE